jgi:hypothetical protein
MALDDTLATLRSIVEGAPQFYWSEDLVSSVLRLTAGYL